MKQIFLMLSMTMLSLPVLGAEATILKLNATQLKGMQVVWQKPLTSGQQMSISYPAEVTVPSSQVRLVAITQAGLVEQLTVSIGDQVRQGQLLGRISSQGLVSLQSEYLQASTLARLKAQAYQRDQVLHKDGIIAQRRFFETQSEYEASQAMLAERKQILRLAGMSNAQLSQLAKSGKLSTSLHIYAPIAGQVTEQHQAVGARVDVASPLFTISQSKPLWLMIQVPVEQAQTMQVGMPVKVNPHQLNAKVEAILRQLNKSNQTVSVRASIAEGTEHLSIGQIVNVQILNNTKGHAMRLPKTALLRKGQQNFVFVKQNGGVAVLPIKLLQEEAHQVVISGKLTPQSEIAIQGVAALKGVWLGMGIAP